jgi:radical SAM superfamily enzyme YgiQ (UPF0313 family)|tara:strand:- start:12 stop:1544 length:1533 start_codon:yes stop_codon:yes gene_type:complete
MRILLFDPPMQSIMQARADWYPMGLAYLAGSVKREGHEVLIYNGEHDPNLDYINLTTYSSNYHLYAEALENPHHPVWGKIRNLITDFKPDVIGITSFSVKYPSAQRIAAIAKDYNSKIPVIMGGQHVSIMTDQVLSDKNIDFIAKGEGEETIIDFLYQFENQQQWDNVLGLSYKNGQIKHNAPRPLKQNLDDLPYPARECLYDIENYEAQSLAKLFASRGCPYQCNYCGTQNIWTTKFRNHSPKRIVDEIKMVKKDYGSTTFTFFDDVFAMNKKYTMTLLDEMIKADLEVKWDCLTRANLLSDELLIKMKEAGCTKIDMGVESGSPKVLKSTKKGLTVEEIENGASLVQKNGLFLYCFFMIGLPYENENDIELTKELLLKIKPDWAGISIFTPIPGTEIWNELQEQGKISENPDYAMFSHQSPHSNFAFSMEDREEFPELAQDMLEFIQNYNGKYKHLFKRALTRGYLKNPGLLIADLKKMLLWKGLLKGSHQGSHSKFYSDSSQSNSEC